jgi:hypothetical protein
MKQKADYKDHDDSEQRKDQRIRKPPLTPVGEPEPKADKALFLGCRVLFWRVGHICDPFGSAAVFP